MFIDVPPIGLVITLPMLAIIIGGPWFLIQRSLRKERAAREERDAWLRESGAEAGPGAAPGRREPSP